MKMMFLARSPRLDDIFMDQEHKHHGNELGRKSSKYTHHGIFRSRRKKERDDENQFLKAYKCRNMIQRMFDHLPLAWILLGLEKYEELGEELGRKLESFSWFFPCGVRPK